MDKCALQYCDFWDDTEQACVLAVEVRKRIELFDRINKILDNAESTEKANLNEIFDELANKAGLGPGGPKIH